jgi:tetratricopeptide (TPR) repeat protein
LTAYESGRAIRRKVAEANPTSTELQGNLANSHNNIGVLMATTNRPIEALKAFESARTIERKLADDNPTVTDFQRALAYSNGNIGNLLNETGHPVEALKAFESGLAIRRKLADANPTLTLFQQDLALGFFNIGELYAKKGKLAEALDAYKSALAIQQKLAREHPESPDNASYLSATLNNLAIIDLKAKRFEEARVQLAEAIDWQRKALVSYPTNPTYRKYLADYLGNLAKAALGLNDLQGVAEAERELTAFLDSNAATVTLDARLSAILRGDQQPRENLERLKLAQRAYDKALHAASAKLWAEALDVDPKLAEDRQTQIRYNAACAAALAGCGQGKDNPPLDDSAKEKLREQARAWLQLELAVWTRFVESGPPQAKAFIAQTLQHWREDTDLAGVREPRSLETLPKAEREPWRALWAGVEALLARAQTAPGPAGTK